MSITKETRQESVEFIHWFCTYLDEATPDSYDTTEDLIKLKNLLAATKDMLLHFTSISNGNNVEVECNNLERYANDIQYYLTLTCFAADQVTLEELIAGIKHLLLIEYRYEAENNLLPGSDSNAVFNIISTRENYLHRYDVSSYQDYNLVPKSISPENREMFFEFVGHKNGHKITRSIKADSYMVISIQPSPKSAEEGVWLRSIVYQKLLSNYASLSLSDTSMLCDKIDNFVTKIDLAIERRRVAELDSVDNSDLSEENSNFNPTDHIYGYSHRTVSIPIIGNLLGMELEFFGNKNAIFKFKRSFERLSDMGFILERDASVDFELKSPIMDLKEFQKIYLENLNLFEAWTNLTDGEKAGLHFHISFDDSFSVNKSPAGKTKLFSVRLAQLLEQKVFSDSDARKTIFKRDYQSEYCDHYGSNDNLNRYRWINFENLDRISGKTIEIRLFSASAANELDKAAERALLIAKLFKYALKDWRAKGRLEYTEWVKSFGDTKIFKALFNKDEIKRWLELFSKPIQSAKVA